MVGSFAQSNKQAPECPPGTHPVLVNNCDFKNFHRPKKNCQSGFWFCFECDGWRIECLPNFPSAFKAIVDDKNKATVWAELTDKSVIFHFPAALKNSNAYVSTDLEKLNVDESLELRFPNRTVKLKIGEYAVREMYGELIVEVPVQ